MSIATTYSNYAHTWWTPEPWLLWVERTFLGCYLDACPKNWDGTDRPNMQSRNMYYNHPGSRGSTATWWNRAYRNMNSGSNIIWCAFNAEQERHMLPAPKSGYWIKPLKRISFIWGGETEGKRIHGQPGKSPGNWTVFYSSIRPAPTPEPCIIAPVTDYETK